MITALLQDGSAIREKGFLFGYDYLVWTLVALQSFGGLMVALVIKYADNIVKGFATSASIVLACLFSMMLFDFQVTYLFAIGALLVMVAVYIYGCYPVQTPVNTANANGSLSQSAQSNNAMHLIPNGKS